MNENAEQAMNELADLYQKAGYPAHNLWGFAPDPGQEAAFGELRVRGYIEAVTNYRWQFTDLGVDWVMERVGEMTPEAAENLRTIGEHYVKANYPPAGLWHYTPDDPNDVSIKELRARGYLEPATNYHWRLTELGTQWVLDNVS